MTGRLVWISEELYGALDRGNGWPAAETAEAWRRSPDDAIAAFIEATRDRWIFGDAEWAVETIALGLRALGRP